MHIYLQGLYIACSMVQNGRMREFLGDPLQLLTVEMMALVDGMPAVLIVHGNEDTVMPVAGSIRFVEALQMSLPDSAVKSDVRLGDHGFDGDATMEEEWLKEDVEFITGYWLA